MIAKLEEAAYLQPGQHHDTVAVENAINALREHSEKFLQNLDCDDDNDTVNHNERR
jgi:hypothetical protein